MSDLFETPPDHEYRFNERPAYHEADEAWDHSRRVKFGRGKDAVDHGPARIKIVDPFWLLSPVKFAYEAAQENHPKGADESGLAYARRLSEIAHSKCERAGVHDGPVPRRKIAPTP